ncbi:DUF2550 domain-containing protein [Pseudokineococcus sp. 1T1Z-3]|uniref:DUF2550 domain-containing protein n=1 Tax=Pseudokineococcus sp. 1T1Z-3 TaxID=3132745 RepID=UPI00309A9E93
MDAALLSLEVTAVLLGLLGLVVLLFLVRRRGLTRRLGAFDCSARREGRRWVLGVAGFRGDHMVWHRVFGVDVGAGRTWDRHAVEVLRRRRPQGSEAFAVLPDAVVVECHHDGERLDLAMSEEAYTAFASWLESAPPGFRVDVA